MLQYEIVCPHCGNEISVNRNTWKCIKCCYCKCFVEINISGNGKKTKIEANATSFDNYKKLRGGNNE